MGLSDAIKERIRSGKLIKSRGGRVRFDDRELDDLYQQKLEAEKGTVMTPYESKSPELLDRQRGNLELQRENTNLTQEDFLRNELAKQELYDLNAARRNKYRDARLDKLIELESQRNLMKNIMMGAALFLSGR